MWQPKKPAMSNTVKFIITSLRAIPGVEQIIVGNREDGDSLATKMDFKEKTTYGSLLYVSANKGRWPLLVHFQNPATQDSLLNYVNQYGKPKPKLPTVKKEPKKKRLEPKKAVNPPEKVETPPVVKKAVVTVIRRRSS